MTSTHLTELAQRRDDRRAITLLWSPSDDSVHINVLDERTGMTVGFPVDRARALDAFYHPFVYAAA
jgi:hypothetical protein